MPYGGPTGGGTRGPVENGALTGGGSPAHHGAHGTPRRTWQPRIEEKMEITGKIRITKS